MPDTPNSESPSLLERVENAAAAQADRERQWHAEGLDRTMYDIQVGMAKGAYGFTKSLVSGLIDLTTFATKLAASDPEAWKKVGETAWGVTKFVGKNFYYTYMASPEEQMQYNKAMNAKLVAIWDDAVGKPWQEAKDQHREAEFLAKATTRGILEIAPFLIGAGELSAASKASKLSETTKVLEAAEVACPAALEAEKAAALANQAEKAAEAEKLLQAEKAAQAAQPEVGVGTRIRQVSPHELNRTHNIAGNASSKNVARIKESIRANGWQGPPIKAVEHDGKLYVFDGHHRLYAAKKLGLATVPVEVVPFEGRPGSWRTLDELLGDAASVERDKIRP